MRLDADRKFADKAQRVEKPGKNAAAWRLRGWLSSITRLLCARKRS
jgi:hypothetical protein